MKNNGPGKVTGLKFEIVLVLSLVVVVQSKVLLNDQGARLMNSGPWIQVALFYTFSARKSWTVLQVDEIQCLRLVSLFQQCYFRLIAFRLTMAICLAFISESQFHATKSLICLHFGHIATALAFTSRNCLLSSLIITPRYPLVVATSWQF